MIVPDGYVIKAKFGLRGNRLLMFQIIGLLFAVLLFVAFMRITASTHNDSDVMQFIRKFDSRSMLTILTMGLLFFIYVHAFVHEKVHQLCYRIFGNKAALHMGFFNPNVTLSIGDVCSRNKAIIVTLSPLIILETIGLVIWPFISGGFLFLIILFLSANVGMATVDLAQSVWLLKYPKNHYFGFDGRDSVIWGPQR